jgi:hypothetical protein
MPRNRSTAETLRLVLESALQDVHTSIPGTVRSYDATTQTAEVEIGVQRVRAAEDEDVDEDVPESLPILQGVPVLWPRGGGVFLHFPMTAGDEVQVFFSEADLNAWRESGGVVDPGVATRHGLAGAVALPGMFSMGNPLADADGTYGRIGIDGDSSQIEFRPEEILAGGNVALAEEPNLEVHLDLIAAALDAIAVRIEALDSGPVVDATYGVSKKATANAINPIATTILKGT